MEFQVCGHLLRMKARSWAMGCVGFPGAQKEVQRSRMIPSYVVV